VPHLYDYLAANRPEDDRDTSRTALEQGLQELVEAMSPSGPYFAGPDLTAVDLALFPFAYRIDALLGHYRDYSLPESGPVWSRYRHWYEAMGDTPIFRATLTDPERYRERLIEHYLPYSRGQNPQDVSSETDAGPRNFFQKGT
jgi:glutathione S-transferase